MSNMYNKQTHSKERERWNSVVQIKDIKLKINFPSKYWLTNLTLLLKIKSKMLTVKCICVSVHICTFPLNDKIKVPLGKYNEQIQKHCFTKISYNWSQFYFRRNAL